MRLRWGRRFGLAGAVVLSLMGAGTAAGETAPSPEAVIAHYADMAQAIYGDSLTGARALQAAVDRLLAHPAPGSLDAARAAWRAARVPYLQSEGFRFGNAVVDAWEPRVWATRFRA